MNVLVSNRSYVIDNTLRKVSNNISQISLSDETFKDKIKNFVKSISSTISFYDNSLPYLNPKYKLETNTTTVTASGLSSLLTGYENINLSMNTQQISTINIPLTNFNLSL